MTESLSSRFICCGNNVQFFVQTDHFNSPEINNLSEFNQKIFKIPLKETKITSIIYELWESKLTGYTVNPQVCTLVRMQMDFYRLSMLVSQTQLRLKLQNYCKMNKLVFKDIHFML